MRTGLYGMVLFLLVHCSAHAQIIAGVSLTRDSIMIGDRTEIVIKLSGKNREIPVYIDLSAWDSLESWRPESDSLASVTYADLEWEDERLAESRILPLDRSQISGNQAEWTYVDSFSVRIWDIGIYKIDGPSIPVPEGQIVRTESPYLFVTIPIDAQPADSTQIIFPIHGIMTEKRSFEDYLLYLWIAAALLLLTLAFLFIKNRKGKNEIQTAEEQKPMRPAHEIAFEKLDELESKELWLNGKVKEHQSELTYIIREYLENRYDIAALEMTTPDIVTALRKVNLTGEMIRKLTEILQIADLVKFAKAQPAIELNQTFLIKAKEFVKQTQQELPPIDNTKTNSNG